MSTIAKCGKGERKTEERANKEGKITHFFSSGGLKMPGSAKKRKKVGGVMGGRNKDLSMQRGGEDSGQDAVQALPEWSRGC